MTAAPRPTATPAPAPAISDYAIVGDCRAAALVSNRGSIDWLCWPRFDSPALFAALLDPDRGGRFAVAPVAPCRVRRRYLDDTNVLETTFDLGEAALVLTDFMPVASREVRRRTFIPDHELVRVIEARGGDVAVEVLFDPRPGFGERPASVSVGRWGDLEVQVDGALLVLRADAPIPLRADAPTRFVLRAGARAVLSLTYTQEAPAVLPVLGSRPGALLDETVRSWRAWVARGRHNGPYRALITRSALAVKLLCYAPSGAVVAAPTTSLPERVGGDLNWDYRYCWLRDAALTVRALLALGHEAEADGFVSWLLHATRLTRPRVRVLYDVFGVAPRGERTLPHLAGYRGSRPVRVGNEAALQDQLDVYGEVLASALALVAAGAHLDGETRAMLLAFGRYLVDRWKEPDSGIWELRDVRRRYTTGVALGAVALTRLAPLARSARERARLEQTATAMRDAIEAHAWSERERAYLDALDGGTIDASLLLLPLYGYADPTSPRMRSTCARVLSELRAGAGLIYRNVSGRLPPEGAFGICSFWAAEALARGAGTLEDARALFDAMAARANDVGLYAEEIDPATGEALGNFPQAYTHVGLINAALALEARAARERGESPAADPAARDVAGGGVAAPAREGAAG